MFLAFTLLVLLLIYGNIGAALITNLIGFIYPAFMTLRGLKSGQTDLQNQIQWQSYWLIFGFLSVLEYFSDVLLVWFPFFYIFKVFGLLYLYLPQTLGATVVFERLLNPIFAHWTAAEPPNIKQQ
jgi:receptor expression-enhancing protein 5/6